MINLKTIKNKQMNKLQMDDEINNYTIWTNG